MIVEGEMVDPIIGLEGARSDIVMLKTPGGGTNLELTRFDSPPAPASEPDAPSNTLCYLRGPAGVIVELAEEIG